MGEQEAARVAAEEEAIKLTATADAELDDQGAASQETARLVAETQGAQTGAVTAFSDVTVEGKVLKEHETVWVGAEKEAAAAVVEEEVGAPAAAAGGGRADEAEATSLKASRTEYICVLRSVIRDGCEFASAQVRDYLNVGEHVFALEERTTCLLYTSPSPRD